MKELIALDIEVLPNYFLVLIKKLSNDNAIMFEAFGKDSSLDLQDRKKLYSILNKYTSFGFNSNNYDMPLINLMLTGASCSTIYKVSKNIVEKGLASYMTYKQFDIEQRPFDHFDIQEPSPAVMISLKNYGTRIGSKKLQEFYLDPHIAITEGQVKGLKDYCMNDVDTTIDLYNAIEGRMKLRESMSEQYGLDLRSKSDAQIAEAVIDSELKKVGVKPYKPTLPNQYKARYVAPDFINFYDSTLNDLVKEIESIDFEVASNGSVKMPKSLANKKINIGDTVYKMGIGGLHSQEKSLSVVSQDGYVMRNADFTSYYPFIILNLGLYPEHLGAKFLDIYRNIVETRLKAKAEGNKLVADSLKITINGSFGKFGSKYSKLYSPDLLLATTITGQLTLLMLIEAMERNDIRVVSANTDGLEYYCHKDQIPLAETLVFDLELNTGFEMEHGEYSALHAANVNNYVAVYDGYTKAKGIYAETTLGKGRQTPIVYEAIRKYLLDGTPLGTTITSCTDINEFISARTVKGGGVYDGNYLGKMVRWYYSLESKGCITYSTNGNKVPKTDGCKPMMDLTDGIPEDLDYLWYVSEAVSKLGELGVDYAEEK